MSSHMLATSVRFLWFRADLLPDYACPVALRHAST
jgi:hypothetical protein